MSQPSLIPALQKWISEPWGHQGRRIIPAAICQPSGYSHSLHLGSEELQDTGPRQLRYTWKEWSHWAQTLASPHTEKNTKFLNLRYLVFFNSQKYFWYSDYLPLVANFDITWLHPHLPGAVLSGLLELVGWYHRLNGHEFEQAPGDGEGQGGLACCSPCSRKGLDTNERLKNSNVNSRCCLQGLSPKSVS